MINGHSYQAIRESQILRGLAEEIREYLPGIENGSCEALARYIAFGVQPGAFLKAMLACDIHEAVRCADATNQDLIPSYVAYFMTLPWHCWGNEEAVANWKGGGGF